MAAAICGSRILSYAIPYLSLRLFTYLLPAGSRFRGLIVSNLGGQRQNDPQSRLSVRGILSGDITYGGIISRGHFIRSPDNAHRLGQQKNTTCHQICEILTKYYCFVNIL